MKKQHLTYVLQVYNMEASASGQPTILCQTHRERLVKALRESPCVVNELGVSQRECAECP